MTWGAVDCGLGAAAGGAAVGAGAGAAAAAGAVRTTAWVTVRRTGRARRVWRLRAGAPWRGRARAAVERAGWACAGAAGRVAGRVFTAGRGAAAMGVVAASPMLNAPRRSTPP